jgi:GNAT superfamily N-acetyltransferase
MTQSFVARDLADTAVPQALPLLRATWPTIDLAAWENFAGSFRCGGREPAAAITGLFDAAGGLCGLFASRTEPGLCDGRILAVPLFTVMDIGNSLDPVRALLDAAEAKAKKQGCATVQIRLASEQSGLSKRLRRLGLEHLDTLYLYLSTDGSGPRLS